MRYLIYLALLVLAVQTCQGQLCPTLGAQCDKTCANVVLCATVGGTPTVLNKCKTGVFCGTNGTWYDCLYDHCSNPDAPHKFQCLQIGTFPSPYQCGKFFVCTKINSAPQLECVCKTGEYFDIPSQSCKASPCPRIAVDCKTPGEVGTVENYCYACSEKFDAYVYRCNFSPAETPRIPRDETCGPYTGL